GDRRDHPGEAVAHRGAGEEGHRRFPELRERRPERRGRKCRGHPGLVPAIGLGSDGRGLRVRAFRKRFLRASGRSGGSAQRGGPHAAEEHFADQEQQRSCGEDERREHSVQVARVVAHRSTSAFRTGIRSAWLTRWTKASTGSFIAESRGWGANPISTMAISNGAMVNHSRTVRSASPCEAALRGGPKKRRWYSQSMYTAPRITPVAANTARGIAPEITRELNVPLRMRNSPTNPFVPGSPIDDSVTARNVAAIAGVTAASPP